MTASYFGQNGCIHTLTHTGVHTPLPPFVLILAQGAYAEAKQVCLHAQKQVNLTHSHQAGVYFSPDLLWR